MTEENGFIALGRITKPFGIKGDVRVKPYNPRSDTLNQAPGVWIKTKNESKNYYKILAARWHKDTIRLTLEGVDSREKAEELRAGQIMLEKDRLPPLEEGEFYWFQLIGMDVYQNRQKKGREKIGRLVRIETTAPQVDGNDVFVVQADDRELLVPATEEAIAEVDIQAGCIVIADEMNR